MLKATALVTLTAAMLAAPIASAQVIDLGRGGPRLDLRSSEQRHDDRMRRRMHRDMAHERGYHRHGRGDGCSTRTVTRTDDYGRRVTRSVRSCD